MKTKQSKELSIEELQSKEKKSKIVIAIFGGMIVLMLISSMVLTMMQGFTVFSVLPVAFLPLLSVLFANLKKIQTEIAEKKSVKK